MRHLSDRILDEHLVSESSDVRAHLAECSDCTERLSAIKDHRDRFLKTARPQAFAAEVLARAEAKKKWRFSLLLIPAFAAAALLLVTLRPTTDVRYKGAAIGVELYVRSGTRTAPYSAARRYAKGDVLQLVYTAPAPYYLDVLDVEAGGKVSVLYRSEAPLSKAAHRRLDQAWRLDDGKGPERIFVVASSKPLQADELTRVAAKIDPATAETLPIAAEYQTSFFLQR